MVASPYIVDARFELNYVIDMRSGFNHPIHATNDPTKRKSSFGISARQLLEYAKHAIPVESAVAKVDLGVGAKLELTSLLGRCRLDPRLCQPSEVVLALLRVNDMDGFVATLETVLNERKQDPILFLVATEKRADMTGFPELGTSKGNRRHILHRAFLPNGFAGPILNHGTSWGSRSSHLAP
jgi:hypothetical protein